MATLLASGDADELRAEIEYVTEILTEAQCTRYASATPRGLRPSSLATFVLSSLV